MITNMLNMRLSDLTKKENPDFIYSGSYNVGRYIRSKEMFVFPLIKAVQELTEMVKSQQKEIEELKKK